jgi:hypothetical protein
LGGTPGTNPWKCFKSTTITSTGKQTCQDFIKLFQKLVSNKIIGVNMENDLE